MSLLRLLFFIYLIFAPVVLSAGSVTVAGDPAVARLLDDVVSRLPDETLVIEGVATVRQREGMRRGMVENEFRFAVELDLGANPPRAVYSFHSMHGVPLEQMEFIHAVAANPQLVYRKGAGLEAAEVPPVDDFVRNSDLTWRDISLAFLWWRNGSFSGHERLRGRSCTVIELLPPESTDGRKELVRLWVDDESLMLLQAETVVDGKTVRRLWVRSVKQIADRWMLKDMEVESYPGRRRTRMTVEEVSAPGQS